MLSRGLAVKLFLNQAGILHADDRCPKVVAEQFELGYEVRVVPFNHGKLVGIDFQELPKERVNCFPIARCSFVLPGPLG